MLSHFVERHDKIAEHSPNNFKIRTGFKKGLLMGQVKLVYVVLYILSRKDQPLVKHIYIKLSVNIVFVRQHKKVGKIYTMHRKLQLLGYKHINDTQRNRISSFRF